MTTLQKNLTLTKAHADYEKSLNSYAYFKVSDHILSEDLVQDTFTKTWKYLMKGGKINTMKAFLYHILNNLIVDEYRKHKMTSLDTMIDNGFEPGIDNTENLFNFLDGKKALLLIKNLPEKFEKVIYMRYVEELSLKEMSSITGQSKNTIGVQVYRGLEKLRLLYNFA